VQNQERVRGSAGELFELKGRFQLPYQKQTDYGGSSRDGIKETGGASERGEVHKCLSALKVKGNWPGGEEEGSGKEGNSKSACKRRGERERSR